MPDLTPAQRALANLMSDLSETCYAAGWMIGCERAIWRLIHGQQDTWGMYHRVSMQDDLDAIWAVAQAADSWIEWDDQAHEERAVPMAEWRSRMEARDA